MKINSNGNMFILASRKSTKNQMEKQYKSGKLKDKKNGIIIMKTPNLLQ